jgi:hypothetical protein
MRNLTPLLLRSAILLLSCHGVWAAEALPSRAPAIDEAQVALANTIAQLVKHAIPQEYEKRKDWGRTKNITVGLRNDGIKIHRRKQPVKHGTWKHYKIRLAPDQLAVSVENLRTGPSGRVQFTLILGAKIDAWARAKIYRYGIHLVALEAVGDATVNLAIDCEVGVQLRTQEGLPGIAIDPLVLDTKLAFTEFQLHRISNAKGPLVRELGEELQKIITKQLQGPVLTAKLNRAIEKKRDRLERSTSQLLGVLAGAGSSPSASDGPG